MSDNEYSSFSGSDEEENRNQIYKEQYTDEEDQNQVPRDWEQFMSTITKPRNNKVFPVKLSDENNVHTMTRLSPSLWQAKPVVVSMEPAEPVKVEKKIERSPWTKVYVAPPPQVVEQVVAVVQEKPEVPKETRLQFTKMCYGGEKCKNPNCTFAHTLDQLSPVPCRFQKSCKYPQRCGFYHEDETKESYLKRIGQLKKTGTASSTSYGHGNR